ncbi:MAG: flagellar basal body rod C-terminal domain-containing protein [bacterium]
MNDSFITAINTQKTTMDWMNLIITNMSSIYLPGFKEYKGSFHTFLGGVSLDDLNRKMDQGKAQPGTSGENIYLEGKGFFAAKRADGKILYTRRGEFTFDGEGVYKTPEGFPVQGYILNDNGEVMGTPAVQKSDPHTANASEGGPGMMATTDIKLWTDPSNGKYLGKYDEFEFKADGILYGKADKGKIVVPLYKVAVVNFPNSSAMIEAVDGYYIESKDSGKPVAGSGEVRSGLIEMSNADLRANIYYLQQAKLQLEMTNKLISTNKQLLEEAMRLLQ